MPAIEERKLFHLDHFLENSFDSNELILFIEEHCDRDVIAELPIGAVSHRSLIHGAVRLLYRRGQIDQSLITALGRARPGRCADLTQIAERMAIPKVDETELKTSVWRPGSGKEASIRLKCVERLEQQLLLREGELDDEKRAQVEANIDACTRQLRRSPAVGAGSVVAGARLEREIGSGNFGRVWRAKRIDDGNTVATKVFNSEHLAERLMLWRFRRSVRAMELLGKTRGVPDSVPKFIAASEDTLAFSMTYVSGGTLEHIERRGWTLATKLSVFAEICRAVDFAHQAGIIHRDIKPANVLMDSGGSPVLVDYDIADIRFVTHVVEEGGLGTPVFAAPEQLDGSRAADRRSDVYSLGRLLHYMLLERAPRVSFEKDPRLANLRSFPAALVAIVRQATQFDPLLRYPSVQVLLADLARCQTKLAAMRAHALAARRWVRGNAAVLAVFCTVSGASMSIAVLQSNIARLEAEKAASVTARFQDAQRLQLRVEDSQRQVQEAVARLASLSTELRGLSLSAKERVGEANALIGRAAEIGLEMERVHQDLNAAMSTLEERERELAEVLNTDGALRPGTDGGARKVLASAMVPAVRHERGETASTALPAGPVASDAPDGGVKNEARKAGAGVDVPAKARDDTYAAIRRTIDLKRRSEMNECFQGRFDDLQRPVRLLLTIGADGRLRKMVPVIPITAAVEGCLKDALVDLKFKVDKREEVEYELV